MPSPRSRGPDRSNSSQSSLSAARTRLVFEHAVDRVDIGAHGGSPLRSQPGPAQRHQHGAANHARPPGSHGIRPQSNILLATGPAILLMKVARIWGSPAGAG